MQDTQVLREAQFGRHGMAALHWSWLLTVVLLRKVLYCRGERDQALVSSLRGNLALIMSIPRATFSYIT